MKKIVAGMILIIFTVVFVSNAIDLKDAFQFIGLIIQLFSSVVKGIIHLLITIFEILL